MSGSLAFNCSSISEIFVVRHRRLTKAQNISSMYQTRYSSETSRSALCLYSFLLRFMPARLRALLPWAWDGPRCQDADENDFHWDTRLLELYDTRNKSLSTKSGLCYLQRPECPRADAIPRVLLRCFLSFMYFGTFSSAFRLEWCSYFIIFPVTFLSMHIGLRWLCPWSYRAFDGPSCIRRSEKGHPHMSVTAALSKTHEQITGFMEPIMKS